jgi:PAS domain S-box-containing protein
MVSTIEDPCAARRPSLFGSDGTILELLPAAVYVCDADGILLRFNRKAAALWGRTPVAGDPAERYSGACRLFRADGSPLPLAETPMAEVLRRGEPARDVEIVIERPDGERRSILATIEPLRAASGAIAGAVGCFQDVTALRQAEAALRDGERRLRELNESLEQQAEERARQLASSRAQLQAFFDVSPDWLTLLRATADGKFVYADLNPTCEAAYGLTRDQVVGRAVEEVLGREAARIPLHYLRECLATGEPQRYVAQRTMAGRTRTIDVVFVPVPGQSENGERLIITTARDITEREDLEAQLRQAQKMEVLGQLTGGVAHDFNNLLTAVAGNLELLEMRIKADPKSARLVHSAQRAAERGAKLTEQLLAFSRRQHLRPQPVDVNSVICGMNDLLARTIGPNIDVQTVLAPDLWPALVDATQLEIALLNLMINARDAMPLGGSILIETRNLASGVDRPPAEIAGRDCLMLAIRDTGTGMSEEVRARAIEPFFTTKGAGLGSGLGLSQVYGVVRQSGGTLAIDSAPGRGTTVRLYLPRATGVPMPVQGSARDGDKADRRGRILVVDDDADVREIAVQMLRQTGYGVGEAENGYAALAALSRGETYDLILIDMVMPGLNGLDAVHRARERWPGVKALFMTGYADTAVHAELAEAGPVIKKPFRLAELSDAVQRTLRSRSNGAAANVVPLHSWH